MGRTLTQRQFQDQIDLVVNKAKAQAARFENDTPELKLRRKARVVVRPEAFNAAYLGHYFRCDPAPFHLELYNILQDARRAVVRAPRSHAKTTVITRAYTLHQVVCAPVLRAWVEDRLEAEDPALYAAICAELDALEAERDAAWAQAFTCWSIGQPTDEDGEVLPPPEQPATPRLIWDPYIQIVAVTDALATGITGAIKDELEKNERILYDWGQQVDDPGRNLDDFVSRSDVRVRAFGFNAAIRGDSHREWRPTLAICDDPDDKKTVTTRRSRDQQQATLMGEIVYGLEPGGRVWVLGTPLHADCLVCRLTRPGKFPGWRKRRYRAITAEGKALWAERWSLADLANERQDDPVAFESEMMDNPQSDDQRPFEGVIGFYNRRDYPDLAQRPAWIILDPSMAASERADPQGVVVVRWISETATLLIDRAEEWRLAPLDLVVAINDLCAEVQPVALLCEANGFQALLASLIELHGAEIGLLQAVETYTSTENKSLRIRGMVPLWRKRRILLPDDGSCAVLERQALDYCPADTKPRDDLLDGVHAGVAHIQRMGAQGVKLSRARFIPSRRTDLDRDTPDHDRRRAGQPTRSTGRFTGRGTW